MTETGLLAAFGAGFIIGGIMGAVGVLVYGKQALDREQPQPRTPPPPALTRRQPWDKR